MSAPERGTAQATWADVNRDVYRTLVTAGNPDESSRRITAGEELTYDYGIVLEERQTPELKRIWACRCGAPRCTGTLLKPKRGKKA